MTYKIQKIESVDSILSPLGLIPNTEKGEGVALVKTGKALDRTEKKFNRDDTEQARLTAEIGKDACFELNRVRGKILRILCPSPR